MRSEYTQMKRREHHGAGFVYAFVAGVCFWVAVAVAVMVMG